MKGEKQQEIIFILHIFNLFLSQILTKYLKYHQFYDNIISINHVVSKNLTIKCVFIEKKVLRGKILLSVVYN